MDNITTNELKTAIAYYRYSSHRQGEQSIEGQRAAAERWAKENGYIIVKEYIDRAQTGMNDKRESFQSMLAELGQVRPGVLILWKVDRMGRNKEEIAVNKHRAKKHGVKVVYTAENIPGTPEGVILESLMEGLAEYYSLQLSQNIIRGLRVSASKAQSLGGNRPLGYVTGPDKKFVIDPEKAAIVRQVFERYVNGETQAEIARSLNKQGHRTLKGHTFTHNSLRSLLTNEKYIGIYKYKDELRIDGGVPAIVDVETFAKAQEMMILNKKAPSHKNKEDYLLTGKIFCGICGGMMVGVSGKGRLGTKYCYYMCNNRRGSKTHKTGCTKRNVRKDWIEEIVIRETKKLLFDDELMDFIAESTYKYYISKNKNAQHEKSLQDNLQKVENALKNIMRAIEAGIFNDTTRQRMDELEAQKKQILIAIEQERLKTGLALTKEHILFFLYKFREFDFDDVIFQKRLIKTFINAIFVYDDKITITFNYTSDNNAITLSEMENSRKNGFDCSALSSTKQASQL